MPCLMEAHCLATACMYCRERKAIDMESHARYLALKARWKTLDVAVSSDYVPSHDLFYLDGQEEEEEEEEETGGSQDAGAKTDEKSAEDGTLLKMLDITARVHTAIRCGQNWNHLW